MYVIKIIILIRNGCIIAITSINCLIIRSNSYKNNRCICIKYLI